MENHLPPPSKGFTSVHKRAVDLVEKDTAFAYAISCELRKRLVGRTAETARYEMLQRLGYGAWNSFMDLDHQRNNPKYCQMVIDLLVDTLLIGHHILTEQRR